MRTLSIFILIPFTLLTLYTIYDVGYIEIFNYQRHSSAGWQVFADLVIALTIVICWMIPDAKANNRQAWPWVVMTLFSGSFGPLLYLAFRPAIKTDNAVSQQQYGV